MIIYNEKLKHEILEEMKRISVAYRIPDNSGKWLWEPAKEYHKCMYRILELMVNFPIAIESENEENKL